MTAHRFQWDWRQQKCKHKACTVFYKLAMSIDVDIGMWNCLYICLIYQCHACVCVCVGGCYLTLIIEWMFCQCFSAYCSGHNSLCAGSRDGQKGSPTKKSGSNVSPVKHPQSSTKGTEDMENEDCIIPAIVKKNPLCAVCLRKMKVRRRRKNSGDWSFCWEYCV